MKINIKFNFNGYSNYYENITLDKAARIIEKVVKNRSKKHRVNVEYFKSQTRPLLEHLTENGQLFTPYMDENFSTIITLAK